MCASKMIGIIATLVSSANSTYVKTAMFRKLCSLKPIAFTSTLYCGQLKKKRTCAILYMKLGTCAMAARVQVEETPFHVCLASSICVKSAHKNLLSKRKSEKAKREEVIYHLVCILMKIKLITP